MSHTTKKELDKIKLFDRKIFLKKYSQKKLDKFLKRGYTCNGISSMRFAVTRIGDEINYTNITSSLSLRVPLTELSFSKSQRKLLRKNLAQFTYTVVPFKKTKALNQLWDSYKRGVRKYTQTPTPIKEFIFGSNNPKRYPVQLVKVYHKKKLVAFSLFLEGKEGLTSLEAAYDINYAKYSLGIFTMLLEMTYGHEQGLKYYYPGFILKDISKFQYKSRLPHLQFFRVITQKWTPWHQLIADDWINDKAKRELILLSKTLCSCTGINFNLQERSPLFYSSCALPFLYFPYHPEIHHTATPRWTVFLNPISGGYLVEKTTYPNLLLPYHEINTPAIIIKKTFNDKGKLLQFLKDDLKSERIQE